jgi:hypothetical protein
MKVYSRSVSWALNKIIYIFIERVSINYYMIYNEIVYTFKVPFRLVEFRVGKQHLAIKLSTSSVEIFLILLKQRVTVKVQMYFEIKYSHFRN